MAEVSRRVLRDGHLSLRLRGPPQDERKLFGPPYQRHAAPRNSGAKAFPTHWQGNHKPKETSAVTKVMILATDGFEQSELTKPKANLEKAGIETTVVSLKSGEIKGWQHTDWGDPVKVDLTIDQASADDFDALMLPGGQMNPDKLRMDERAVQIVKDFADADKPIAAICHGPWLLVEADIVDGKTVTSWPSIRTDLMNAGADVVDREVVTDGNLITSRKPEDIPAFSKALIEKLGVKVSGEMERA